MCSSAFSLAERSYRPNCFTQPRCSSPPYVPGYFAGGEVLSCERAGTDPQQRAKLDSGKRSFSRAVIAPLVRLKRPATASKASIAFSCLVWASLSFTGYVLVHQVVRRRIHDMEVQGDPFIGEDVVASPGMDGCHVARTIRLRGIDWNGGVFSAHDERRAVRTARRDTPTPPETGRTVVDTSTVRLSSLRPTSRPSSHFSIFTTLGILLDLTPLVSLLSILTLFRCLIPLHSTCCSAPRPHDTRYLARNPYLTTLDLLLGTPTSQHSTCCSAPRPHNTRLDTRHLDPTTLYLLLGTSTSRHSLSCSEPRPHNTRLVTRHLDLTTLYLLLGTSTSRHSTCYSAPRPHDASTLRLSSRHSTLRYFCLAIRHWSFYSIPLLHGPRFVGRRLEIQ